MWGELLIQWESRVGIAQAWGKTRIWGQFPHTHIDTCLLQASICGTNWFSFRNCKSVIVAVKSTSEWHSLQPNGLLLLKPMSMGKFKTNSWRSSRLFFAVCVKPSSRPLQHNIFAIVACDLPIYAICKMHRANFVITHVQLANFWPKPNSNPDPNLTLTITLAKSHGKLFKLCKLTKLCTTLLLAFSASSSVLSVPTPLAVF